MTTTIECAKSEFIDQLRQHFEDLYWTTDGRDVIDGLVRQANSRPGVYAGHNAYLNLDFRVIDPTCGTCGGTDYTPEGACYGCCSGLVRPARHGEVDPRNPAIVKTMADYAPSTAVKRMLAEASYVRPGAAGFHLLQVAVEAERTEQGIEASNDECGAWIVEYVHELIACAN